MDFSVFLISLLACGFVFGNGLRDSASIVATVVSTRALSSSKAFMVCALGKLLGAVFVGTAVIKTVGGQLFSGVQAEASVAIVALASGLLSAILWGIFAWTRGWPTSNNQALMSGLVGAVVAGVGWEAFHIQVLFPLFVVLISSPLLGFIGSIIITRLIRILGAYLTPQAERVANRTQIFSSFLVSIGHGSNDIQLVLGIVLLAASFIGSDFTQSSDAFPALRATLALCGSLGVLIGGKRILKRVGMSFYHIRSDQGLGAQATSALALTGCLIGGWPASTTQLITGSVLGAGVAKNHKAVRWKNALAVVLSWPLTAPTVFVLGFVLCKGLLFLRRTYGIF